MCSFGSSNLCGTPTKAGGNERETAMSFSIQPCIEKDIRAKA